MSSVGDARGATERDTASPGPAALLDALAKELTVLRARMAEVDYRAAVLGHLVGADDQRHIDIAAGDLERALVAFRGIADAVVERSAQAAAGFGVRPDERTLAVLAERAPDRWREELRGQAEAIARETAQLRERLRADSGIVTSGHRQISATLQLLLGDADAPVTYEPPANRARLVDHLA